MGTISDEEFSVGNLFLKHLQSKFAETAKRGRSARVIGFCYGESLISHNITLISH